MQPVHIDDLVKVIVTLVDRDDINNVALEVGGGSVMMMNEFVDMVCKTLRVKRLKIHLPIAFCKVVFKVHSLLFRRTIINAGMLASITRDKVCDNTWLKKNLGISPVSLTDGMERVLLKSGREAG